MTTLTELTELTESAATCTRCDLYKRATQTVRPRLTIHPSAVLRGPDPKARDEAYAGLVADLEVARAAAGL